MTFLLVPANSEIYEITPILLLQFLKSPAEQSLLAQLRDKSAWKWYRIAGAEN